MSIVSLDQCNSSFSLPIPQLCGSHTHTSFSFINFWDLFWLLLSCWRWCIMWQGGVWTLLLFYATYYSKTSKMPLLIDCLGVSSYHTFQTPSTWRAPKLWQWGAPHWLVGSHEIFFRVLLPNGSWIHSHFTHVSSFVVCTRCMNRMGDACS